MAKAETKILNVVENTVPNVERKKILGGRDSA